MVIAVFGTMNISVQNRHQSPLRPLNHRHKRVVELHLRGRSPSGMLARQPCGDNIKGKCTRPSCDYWRPPECQFYKKESGRKFGDKCSFMHRQFEDQLSKKPKKDGDKNAVATLKDSRQFGCVFQDIEPPESAAISRKVTNVLGAIRRVQF